MPKYTYELTLNEVEADSEDEAFQMVTEMLASGSFDLTLVRTEE